MSKTDFSLRLLAIFRFAVPSNSSRTLNATQAYDVTSSGITLANAIGTLVDKDAAVKAPPHPKPVDVNVGLTTASAKAAGTVGSEKQTAEIYDVSTATLNMTSAPPKPLNMTSAPPKPPKRPVLGEKYRNNASYRVYSTAGWTGTSTTGLGWLIDASNKPKATNPNTTFYGAITVGTGDYKKWQGNYAVLKINTATGKGVLRIYDDA